MPVPNDDVVCRFIKPSRNTWSREENRPKQQAFKQKCLSVWHQGQLRARGISLEDLLIEDFTGYGQAHHKAGDYLKFARQVSRDEPFEVLVEWRTNEVTGPWRRWNYAHVQVEATKGPPTFPREFRRLLALNARSVVSPA